MSCFPYFIKVHAAGGIKAYEKAHLKRLVAMLVHKFPQLPAAVHPNIVRHWAHGRITNHTKEDYNKTIHSTCRSNHPRHPRAPQKHSVRESSTASSGAPPE